MEVVLLLLGARRDGHVVAVEVGEIFVWLLYSHDGLPLKLYGCRLSVERAWHDAAMAEIMVNHEVGSVVVVGFLQLLHDMLHVCQFVELSAEQGYP